jgi:hypothetical protein
LAKFPSNLYVMLGACNFREMCENSQNLLPRSASATQLCFCNCASMYTWTLDSDGVAQPRRCRCRCRCRNITE